DSPLGVLEVPRREAARYVFAEGASPAPPAGIEEVELVDGTVLHGRLTTGKDGFELAHELLGTVALPSRSLRSVVRHDQGVVWLAEREMQVSTAPPIAPTAAPEPSIREARNGHGWLRSVRVRPRATVRYRLPDMGGKPAVFRAGLRPLDGSRGDLRLRVRAGGKTVFDEELAASAEWPALALKLPPGRELTVEVDFGSRIRFPCGVALCDPLVIAN
ncbi:MAG: hypothetical protein ACODAJ_09565, partial [Planctomycetota bacterium]